MAEIRLDANLPLPAAFATCTSHDPAEAFHLEPAPQSDSLVAARTTTGALVKCSDCISQSREPPCVFTALCSCWQPFPPRGPPVLLVSGTRACSHPALIQRQEEEGDGGLAVVLFLSDTTHGRVARDSAECCKPSFRLQSLALPTARVCLREVLSFLFHLPPSPGMPGASQADVIIRRKTEVLVADRAKQRPRFPERSVVILPRRPPAVL